MIKQLVHSRFVWALTIGWTLIVSNNRTVADEPLAQVESSGRDGVAQPKADGSLQYGKLTGRIVFQGTPPKRRVLIEKGSDVKDKAVCANATIYADDLLVDSKSSGVKNVVVYMRRKPKHIHPQADAKLAKEFVIDMSKCRFEPHVAIIRTNQIVRIEHGEVLHHAHANAIKNPSP